MTPNHKPEPSENFEKLVEQISFTHESLQATAVKAVDSSLVLRNFLIGFYITKFEGGGVDWSAIYGKHLLKDLAKRLKDSGLRGVSATNLRLCRRFYECYQRMEQALPAPSFLIHSRPLLFGSHLPKVSACNWMMHKENGKSNNRY
jgi:hypothetical protein